MLNLVKRNVKNAFRIFGFEVRSSRNLNEQPVELDAFDRELIRYVKENNLSMVPEPGLINTIKACRYVVENKIPGDFVECGVWRGGNAIIATNIFKHLGEEKKVWLFDTFEGMTEPTEKDISVQNGKAAKRRFSENQRKTHNEWCYASLEDCRTNLLTKNAEMRLVNFVRGDVKETLQDKKNIPESISILRLDTDWYISTRVEMENLYPILSKGGVLIVDDYGHWSGSKMAVDEYFQGLSYKPLLHVVNAAGARSGVKI